VRTLAGIFREMALDDKKEEPIPEKLKEVRVETRTAPSIDFAESSSEGEEYVKHKAIKGVQANGLGSY
jgi:hypothetical protein